MENKTQTVGKTTTESIGVTEMQKKAYREVMKSHTNPYIEDEELLDFRKFDGKVISEREALSDWFDWLDEDDEAKQGKDFEEFSQEFDIWNSIGHNGNEETLYPIEIEGEEYTVWEDCEGNWTIIKNNTQ